MAFAEGRKTGCIDFGNVDLLLKTSKDNGLHWSETKVIAEFDSLQAGNPAPVFDRFDPNYPEGRIFYFTIQEMRQKMKFVKVKDLGKSILSPVQMKEKNWSQPLEITQQVHFNKSTGDATIDWRTHATTPGHAFQFKYPPYQGRIYIPANHSQGPLKKALMNTGPMDFILMTTVRLLE